MVETMTLRFKLDIKNMTTERGSYCRALLFILELLYHRTKLVR
jgi:hypothetical protein